MDTGDRAAVEDAWKNGRQALRDTGTPWCAGIWRFIKTGGIWAKD